MRFTGRTQHFLSAFGEHLIGEEVEKAVSQAARETRSIVNDFCVGPVFPDTKSATGYHLYLVEFDAFSDTLGKFPGIIDKALKSFNEDYEAHRAKDISITLPQLLILKNGAFAAWMKSRGKLGGQHKVPRLDNSGEMINNINKWMSENDYILSE